MLLPAIILAIAIRQAPDTWSLKASFDPKDPKQVWAIVVDAQSEGAGHHAVFNLTRRPKSASDKKAVVTYGWEKLVVDEKEGQEIDPWDAVMGPQGQILQMDGDSDDSYRRMLSPMTFIYPDKPVAIGDKWTVEVKPPGNGQKLAYTCEAKAAETVEGTNTLAVTVKIKEDGDGAISGEGVWWISRVGKIVKFQVKLTNWVVPMAGSDVTDVVIKGIAL